MAAELVRDHRAQVTRYAAQRARAVRRANQHGVSYRQIAEALTVSIGMVQQWMRAALRLEEQRGVNLLSHLDRIVAKDAEDQPWPAEATWPTAGVRPAR